MTKTYRSDILAAVHETAEDLRDAGAMEKRTLRRFDEMCLTPVEPMNAAAIRALRARERVSQAVFARGLLLIGDSAGGFPATFALSGSASA